MNKRIRNIIILSLVLAVILGANIWLRNAIGNSNSEDNSDANQSEYISNYSVGSVSKIKIENDNGTVILTSKDDIWSIEGREDAELDQGVISELAYMLTHIVGERTVSDTNDTTNTYGMLSPSATITTYHEGVLEQTFIIGNEAPIENEYYLQSSVFNKVYTVDMAYYIYGQITIEDLILINGIDIEHVDMKKIKISNTLGEEFTIRRTLDDNDISLCYWEFVEPFNHDIDTAVMYGSEQYEGMITYITQLIGDRIVGSIESDSTEYGLDNPIFTADISSNSDRSRSLAIGDYGDDENYSLKLGDDNNLYIISKDTVPFIDYSAYMIAEANLDLINIDVVDKLTIDLPDLKTEINISHTIKKNDDGTDTEDTNGNVVYEAGINIDTLDETLIGALNIDEQKIWFYQDIATIKIDDLLLENSVGDKIGSILYNLNSKYKSLYLIEFYEYNKSYYIARKNNEEAGYLVNKESIEELVNRYNLLLKGELTIDY